MVRGLRTYNYISMKTHKKYRTGFTHMAIPHDDNMPGVLEGGHACYINTFRRNTAPGVDVILYHTHGAVPVHVRREGVARAREKDVQ